MESHLSRYQNGASIGTWIDLLADISSIVDVGACSSTVDEDSDSADLGKFRSQHYSFHLMQ